ncbi:MAG: DUF952 domain-containing protein, partial [Burkholderiaceae bacterium]
MPEELRLEQRLGERLHDILERAVDILGAVVGHAAGETDGAPIDVTDGFIHFSTAAQVAETAAKHFATESDLV